MRKLPELGFVYINFEKTYGNWLKRKKIYWGILGEDNFDKFDFKDYVKDCSLEDLVYLFVYLCIDKYPKDHIFPLSISSDPEDNVIEEYIDHNQRIVSETIHSFNKFKRKDISKFIYQFHFEEYGLEEQVELGWASSGYSKYFFIEFTEEISRATIEEVISHKKYTTKETKEGIIYTIVDSPIASLEVTTHSIKLTINKDKVIDYAYVL